MSEQLRRQIVERHGPELGEILYEAEASRRARMAERASKLSAELGVVRAELDKQSTALAQNLPPLEDAMERAYQAWIAAVNALEPRRILNQTVLMPLQECISTLVAEMNPAPFADRLTQWGVPDWHRPLPDVPPMVRT